MAPGVHDHDHPLPDGTTVRIRRMTPDDAPLLLAMWERTSARSRQLRFHGPFDLNERNVDVFTDHDPAWQLALAATTGRDDDTRLVGVSRYVIDRDQPDHAEFAALVEDAHQGRGIGSALVRHVAEVAHEAGVRILTGDVLAENASMLRVIRDLGLEHTDRRDASVVRSDLRLDLSEHFLQVVDERGSTAARAALARFLEPASIAVVDSSPAPDATGRRVVRHLRDGGYTGTVLPVLGPGPPAAVGSDGDDDPPGHPRLADLEEVPDLVVVASPADEVVDLVDEAGHLGVHALCILSSGFADSGEDGWRRQADLMRRARSHGLRIVGPNCMGLVNLDPALSMNASTADRLPPHGRTAFLSQSGALGTTILDLARARGLGISTFASVGNKADISGNDLLRWWEQHDDTDQVLLYLESFGNPRTFSRIARRVGRRKPIVVVKAARTRAGARASTRGTVARSGTDDAVDALFAQTGVIRTATLSGMFDVAEVLATQPLPRGARVGIVSNAAGPSILAADAVEAHGLDVVGLSARTREHLVPLVGGADRATNPVDVRADGTVEDFESAIRVLGTSIDVDALLVVLVPDAHHDPDDLVRAVVRVHGDIDERLTVLAVTLAADGRGVPPALRAAGIPTHPFPESAARTLGRVARYGRWRRRPLGTVVEPDDREAEAARRLVRGALASTPELEHAHPAARSAWLDPIDAHVLLDHYGIRRARSRFVTTPDAAGDAFQDLGAPVVVKLVDGAPHETLLATVEAGRRSRRAAAAAARDLIARREAGLGGDLPPRFRHPEAPRQVDDHPEHLGPDPGCRLLVQETLVGVALAVMVRHDPVFGPVVSVGLGGDLADLVGDRSTRVTPLTDHDIDDMLDDLRIRPLLEGWRGAPPADLDAVRDLLARVNAMVEDLPEVTEVVMNPVFAGTDAATVADVRVRIAPSGPPTDRD